MSELRKIETASFAKVAPPATFGRPPKLEWLSIRQLVVDPQYQREITNQGRTNVRQIAEQFNWSMFGTVIVASIGGNRYAIVDGQHRTTAAALCGLDNVPCQVIEAPRGEQAAAFRAINGNVTKLHPLQLFHAAVAAGDPVAKTVADICAAAGVRIVRSPTQSTLMKLGDTMVTGAIEKGIIRFGAKIVTLALKTLVGSGDGNVGLLNRPIVWGAIEVLAAHPEWCLSEKVLIDGFDTVDLDDLRRDASARAARVRGTSATDLFKVALTEALSQHFKRAAALDMKRKGIAP